MLTTAIILAGGYGTRLKTVVSDVPKPMAPVNGEPFLNYQLHYLAASGIKNIILSVGHLAEKIEQYYGPSFQNMRISYVKEEAPLGTGGGIRLAMQQCADDNALTLNGDSFFDVDLYKFYELHNQHASNMSLALRSVEDAARYGALKINSDCRIVSFTEKNNSAQPGLINGGVYILNKTTYLKHTPAEQPFSIEKDFFETQLAQLHITGFEFNGYFIDIGIPEDYTKAQHDLKGFKYR